MTQGLGFTHAAICQRDLIYVVAVVDELDAVNMRHAVLWKWDSTRWQSWTVQNRIIAACSVIPSEGHVLFVGNDGNMVYFDGKAFRQESIRVPLDGPNALRTLTSARVIGKSIFVVGMQRQVFRRPLQGGPWIRADQGTLENSKPFKVAGFLSLDGLCENDIYAAGYFGEIWHYDGNRWRSLDSPTNVKITAVCCVTPEVVYLSGEHGLLLRGNKNGWVTLGDGITPQTYWSLEYFGESLYISNNQGQIFQILDDEIVPVDLQLEREVSTFVLTQGDNTLLSIGNQDLLLFDGKSWSPLTLPSKHH